MEPQEQDWRIEQDLPRDEDWRRRIPFLCDYNMCDEMLISSIAFHISSKKYSLNLKLRQNSSTVYAHQLLDPSRLDDRERSFYAKLVEIYYRIEYLQDLITDVEIWRIKNNSQASNTLFWMDVVNEAVEDKLLTTWRKLIRSWRARAQTEICIQQRNRMMEFAMLINTKVRDVSIKNYNFPAKENHITFKILRYAFDFHPLNKKAFYKRDEGQDTLKRKLFDMEE